MRVEVGLEGKALQVVLDEQSLLAKRGTSRGKAKVISALLCELYERRIYDTIATPLTNKQWRKYLKTI